MLFTNGLYICYILFIYVLYTCLCVLYAFLYVLYAFLLLLLADTMRALLIADRSVPDVVRKPFHQHVNVSFEVVVMQTTHLFLLPLSGCDSSRDVPTAPDAPVCTCPIQSQATLLCVPTKETKGD